mmetsp:Transcript_49936/g.99114  ORF Transcript_49936/g.99114 Transcript_49936/m.99114 type:complete len:148 (+) Transcript_49936:74-517(+)
MIGVVALSRLLRALLVAAVLSTGRAHDCNAASSCPCLVECEAYGQSEDNCLEGVSKDTGPAVVIDRWVSQAIKEEKRCNSMKCVVECAQKLNCINTALLARCNMFSHKAGCKQEELDCAKGAGHRAHAGAVMPLLATIVAWRAAVAA